ncbi:uncharacterized protein METZ01_LOCUS177927, partial [marine metagenome]
VVVVEVNGYEIGPGADLTGADLTGADLTDVDLNRANLEGAPVVAPPPSGEGDRLKP